MKTFRRFIAPAALLALLSIPPAYAQSNNFGVGTLFDSPGVSGADTIGEAMAGMAVQWIFADGTTGSGVWADIGGGGCGVNSGGVRVFVGCEQNTSFDDDPEWKILNNSQKVLTSIRFNGAPGQTVFDCNWSAIATACASGFSLGTAHSSFGVAHVKTGGTFVGFGTGSYTNLVGVAGAPPVGDLFEQFTLTFSGLPAGENFFFKADTDTAVLSAPVPGVPEPGTYALLLAGLVGLSLVHRRRRQA